MILSSAFTGLTHSKELWTQATVKVTGHRGNVKQESGTQQWSTKLVLGRDRFLGDDSLYQKKNPV